MKSDSLVKIGDLAAVKGGKRLPKGVNLVVQPTGHPYIRIRDLDRKTLEINRNYAYVDAETQKTIARYIVNTGDILISIVGTIGLIGVVGSSLNNANLTENCVKLINIDESRVDREYLYYFLLSPIGQAEIKKGTVGAVQPKLPIKNIQAIEIPLIDLEAQKQIGGLLASIDEKIAINNKINDNLEQQVRALYRQIFVDSSDCIASVCRADELFDISIGKTPPRKEPQWFTTNPNGVTWVSISDMGSCGTFISSSSEQLTAEAVEKFNVKVVPSNTVLLSFKLTVGRIAITDGEMATNEAIAHFKTDKPEINEYLYCYLKDFNYQTMGSTSSIATAVNSKIVKAMPFSVPTDEALERFHAIAKPMFSQIKMNQEENRNLSTMRNVLLLRLIPGGIDWTQIK